MGTPTYHVRWLIRRDMPDIVEIESESFDHPWSEEEFTRQLRHRNVIAMVAEVGGRVLGYMVYELHNTQIVLLNFAVDRACRRRGVGRAMAEKLMGKLHHHRRTRIVADVRETNLAAQLFFRSLGWQCISIVPDAYEDVDEPAYRFVYRVNSAAEAAGRVS